MSIPTYHMNKKECRLDDREVFKEILSAGKYVTVAMCRDNRPYVITLNYGYDPGQNALYFHTAGKGLKIDIIRDNPQVCATVLEDMGYKMGKCDHAYRSLVLWGTMEVIEELEQKKYGMDILLRHLEDDPEAVKARTLKDDGIYERRSLAVLKMQIDHIDGKQGQ